MTGHDSARQPGQLSVIGDRSFVIGHRSTNCRDMGDQDSYPYATHLDIKYPPLAKIALDPLVAAVRDQWYNQTLARVNDSVVRLGVMQGEYHWHKHDDDDEFFFVVDGRFLIDLEDRTVELTPRQGFTVPRGVMHRPRAPERTVILMVE